jgi:plastocyanin domain-containing protein
MNSTDWLVLIASIAGIIWVNWYFLLSRPAATRAAVSARGAQEVKIEVKGGYSPAQVRVSRGKPVRMIFDRQETSGCSEEVVLSDFGVRKFLPAFKQTVIEINPDRAGSYEFTCGMNMLRGKLIVE